MSVASSVPGAAAGVPSKKPPSGGGLYGGGGGKEDAFEFNAPVNFGNMFGPDSDDEVNERNAARGDEPIYDVQTHAFPNGRLLKIRQFDDHITNANAVWSVEQRRRKSNACLHALLCLIDARALYLCSTCRPESRFLAGWLCGEQEGGAVDLKRFQSLVIDGDSLPPAMGVPDGAASSAPRRQRVLELGAACGALSIFLSLMGADVTASDIDDSIVTANIRANAVANGVPDLKVLPHTWGRNLHELEADAKAHGAFDLIVATDILNYEKEFDNLVRTLMVLMPRPLAEDSAPTAASRRCVFRMVWKRRSKGKAQEANFFEMLKAQHFDIQTEGQKVFEIRRI